MTAPEVFLLCGSGYVCGLAVSSGFVMSALLQIHVKGKAVWRHWLWSAYMIANTVTAALIPIFMIGVLVVADEPGRTDFWPRALLFGGGVGVGALFVLISAYSIGEYLRTRGVGSTRR